MEAGDGRKNECISKGVPAITPVLPVPLASFPVILEADLAKCFLRGGIGTSFPHAFAPLWKGASPPRPLLCCHWVPTVLPEPSAARGLQPAPAEGNVSGKMHNWTRRDAGGWRMHGNAQGERAR